MTATPPSPETPEGGLTEVLYPRVERVLATDFSPQIGSGHMKRNRALAKLALVAVLAACGAEVSESSARAGAADTNSDVNTQPPDATPSATLITPDGWGPLRIGMSRAEVVAAAGEDANPDAVGGPNPDECDEFRPTSAPDGVLVMIESGVLTRISVSRNRDIGTPEGLRIGDPASAVLDRYGSRARVEPHKYSEAPAKYITVGRESPATDPRGIRYEIDTNDDVAHLRAGGPSIEYVEGCL